MTLIFIFNTYASAVTEFLTFSVVLSFK